VDKTFDTPPIFVPGLLPLEDCEDFQEVLDQYTVADMNMGDPVTDTAVNYTTTMPGKDHMHTYLYGEPLGQQIQKEIQPDIERLVGRSLMRSYVSSRKYFKGNELYRHTDRDSCEVSVSICLGGSGDWPIHMAFPKGKSPRDTFSFTCKRGDGIIYPGVVIDHWRNTLEHDNYYVLLVHYVNANGPFVDSGDRQSDLEHLKGHTSEIR